MILSDKSLKERLLLEEGDLRKIDISPFLEDHLQPASYDISLSKSFAIPATNSKVKKVNEKIDYKYLHTDTFTLYPKKFVLASTNEYLTIPDDILVKVEGRSSIGRMGLIIQTAGVVDPGFDGQITLELFNAGSTPIELSEGMRIGQLIFYETTTPAEKPYSGKYQGQTGATGSMLYKDFKEE